MPVSRVGGICFLSLPQVPGVALAVSLVLLHCDRDACAQPPWQLSCQADTGPQVQCWLDAEAALGDSAPTPFSVLMANVPWLCSTRLCLGALWVSWPVSGDLSHLAHSQCCGVGDFHLQTISFCLCSFFSPFKEQCCFPHSLQQWDPWHVPVTGSPAEPDACRHFPCWADRGAPQPLPYSHTTLHTVAIGTRGTAAPSQLQAEQ